MIRYLLFGIAVICSSLGAATVDKRGFTASLEPMAADGVWGAWKATLTGHRGEKIETKVCDFQSAADYDDVENAFSIWF